MAMSGFSAALASPRPSSSCGVPARVGTGRRVRGGRVGWLKYGGAAGRGAWCAGAWRLRLKLNFGEGCGMVVCRFLVITHELDFYDG